MVNPLFPDSRQHNYGFISTLSLFVGVEVKQCLYHCSCLDSFIKNGSCKHRFLAVTYMVNGPGDNKKHKNVSST